MLLEKVFFVIPSPLPSSVSFIADITRKSGKERENEYTLSSLVVEAQKLGDIFIVVIITLDTIHNFMSHLYSVLTTITA